MKHVIDSTDLTVEEIDGILNGSRRKGTGNGWNL